MKRYIHSSDELGKEFYLKFKDKGEIVMLNMLRYKKSADYSEYPDLEPDQPISGEEAYGQYMKLVLPIMEKFGGKLQFLGSSWNFLIGPHEERWDNILMVAYPSVDVFMSFIQSMEYQKIAGHRTAALDDSRLLPITELRQER